MPVPMTSISVANQLGDVYWRLNNLYHCINKKGNCVRFRMNDAQRHVFESLWWRTIVPKSRQKGFTTFFAIFGLDYAFFNPDKNVAFQAHSAVDSTRIYIDKILFPLSKMPDELLDANPTTRQQKAGGSVSFLNGSSINVALSFRSATINLLHVSEMGKIAAAFPHRAREIVTGTLPAVPLDGRVIIESTSEGAYGAYYDLCMAAQAKELSDRRLSRLDFKIHFSGWTTDPDCYLSEDEAQYVVISDADAKYFAKIEEKLGEKLSDGQKAWYVTMKETQGAFIYQEFPADLDECFQTVIEGAYYKDQLDTARASGRIGDYPPIPGIKVHTFWDLGLNDCQAIWFVQEYGGQFRVVYYYQADGEDLTHYCNIIIDYLKEHDLEMGEHWGPHDIEHRIWTSAQTRIEVAYTEYGIKFYTAPNIAHADGIDAVRRIFKHCVFHEAGTKDGLAALTSYQKEYDPKRGCYRNKALHNWASDGSDAFRYFAVVKGALAEKQDGPSESTSAAVPEQDDIWSNVGV